MIRQRQDYTLRYHKTLPVLSCLGSEQLDLRDVEHVVFKPINIGAIVNEKSAAPDTGTVAGILASLARPKYPMKGLTRSKDRPISSQSHSDALPQAKSLCKPSRSSV